VIHPQFYVAAAPEASLSQSLQLIKIKREKHKKNTLRTNILYKLIKEEKTERIRPDPLGRKSRPTMLSKTEDFPEL
jgi:hypothetical protein